MEQKQSLRDLLIKAPSLCGLPEVTAKRYGAISRIVWDGEMNGDLPEFADADEGEEHPESRLDPLFDWVFKGPKSRGKADYIRKLSVFCALRHRILKHGKKQFTVEADRLHAEVSQEESSYPDVAAVYSVEQAAQGVWW